MTALVQTRPQPGLLAPAPYWILRSLILFLAIGISLWLQGLASGSIDALIQFTRVVGDAFLIACAAVEVWFAFVAWREFSREQPMWLAWAFIAASSVARLAGSLLAHGITPTGRWYDIGIMIGSPFALFLLAIAFTVVLHVYRSLGLHARLKPIDAVSVLVIAIFTGRQVWEIFSIVGGRPASAARGVICFTDLLLCILLVQALLLWRRASSMQGGFIAYCWQAYAVAVAFTALGDVGLWIVNWHIVPYPLNSITWLLWFPAAAAFAIGPACQFEAIRCLGRART